MVENIYSLIYVLLFIGLIVSIFLEPELTNQDRSELHAYNRYAVTEQITRYLISENLPAREDLVAREDFQLAGEDFQSS